MSSKKLKSFLLKVQADLEKNSEEYRKAVSDVRVHTFYLSLDGLKNQVKFQMNIDGVAISKRDLNKICSTFFESLKKSFMGNLKGIEIFDRGATSTDFFITFRSKSKTKGPIVSLDARKTFDSIKYIYLTPRFDFLNVVQTYYKKSKQQLNRSQFLDLGHSNDSSVIKRRVSDLLQYGEIPAKLAKVPEVSQILKLQKIDAKDTVVVTLESSYANRRTGRDEERSFKVQVQKDLEKAISKLDVLNQDGSDSAVTRTRKKAVKRVTDPFKKVKGAIVVTENTKVNKSSTVPTSVSQKQKVTHEKSRGKTKLTAIPMGARTRAKQSTLNVKNLIGIINSRLQDTVAKNMREPRLVNRSGRFVGSVRVTDINETKEGFPSIGYTYAKQPYQVYERTSGTRFASADRDPRALIDMSIREIAAQFALGRIFTRRV